MTLRSSQSALLFHYFQKQSCISCSLPRMSLSLPQVTWQSPAYPPGPAPVSLELHLFTFSRPRNTPNSGNPTVSAHTPGRGFAGHSPHEQWSIYHLPNISKPELEGGKGLQELRGLHGAEDHQSHPWAPRPRFWQMSHGSSFI